MRQDEPLQTYCLTPNHEQHGRSKRNLTPWEAHEGIVPRIYPLLCPLEDWEQLLQDQEAIAPFNQLLLPRQASLAVVVHLRPPLQDLTEEEEDHPKEAKARRLHHLLEDHLPLNQEE